MGDFPKPTASRLTLGDGATIDIKQRLTHGETEDMYARISPNAEDVNRREVRTAKILTYLVGWSLTDDGTPVPFSPMLPEAQRLDLIRSLDQDRAIEIYTAIETHEAAMTAERAKKDSGWAERRQLDVALAVRAGWCLEWVRALDVDDYATLVDVLKGAPE